MIQQAGTALPQHTLPGTEAMVFPRPDITGSRGAGLSVPPTAAQPWLCSSALGFFQPHPQTRWVSFAAPSPRADCVAGARATRVSMATLLLRAERATSMVPSSVAVEDPDSRFSLASKAALEGSSAALEGGRVTHVRQGPSGSTAVVAPFHTWLPHFPWCKVGLTGTADMILPCHNHTASPTRINCFSQRHWSHQTLTRV